MEPILELRALSKDFPGHRAVHEVCLSVPRGGFFSLLGPSGCGKTTTLRLVAGFETPTAGEIWLNGQRIDLLPPYRRNVNTVFQSYALFPHLSVQGNVEFGLRGNGRARLLTEAVTEGVAERVARVLEQVQLTGKEARKPSELSGGERQRVALARSLVLAPDVLLLDEPLSALDPQLRKQVRSELKELQRRTEVTFLFVTHDQEEALSLSDSMAVMKDGAVEQQGTPQELYQRPRTRFVAEFLGAMNWVNGAGIRPEAMHISRHAPEGGGKTGVVVETTFLGAISNVEVQLQGGEVATVRADGFSKGDAVHLCWDPADEMRFSADEVRFSE